ncbi:Homeodomain-like domain-containing protein, partial [[Clostridium] polysaccharolyticum]
MIIQTNITTDLTIYSLNDLTKLKPFLEDSTLKINKSQIARELNVDRRTVDKYLHGFEKSHTRKKKSVIDDFHSIIE